MQKMNDANEATMKNKGDYRRRTGHGIIRTRINCGYEERSRSTTVYSQSSKVEREEKKLMRIK